MKKRQSIIDRLMFQIFDQQIKNIEISQIQMDEKEIQLLSGQVESRYDLPYIYDNNEKHNYDYFTPVNFEGKLPLIIDVHGGAFSSGDKKYNVYYGKYIAAQGYQVVTLNYDLIPDVNILGQIQQIAKGIAHAVNTYALYLNETDGSKERVPVYLTGDSSGTYVISLLCGIWQMEDAIKAFKIEKPSFSIAAIGLTGAPGTIEIFPRFMSPFRNHFHKMMLHDCEYIEKYLELSLYEKLNLPPMFFMSCEEDMYYKNCKNQEDRLIYQKQKTGSYFLPKKQKEKLFHCFNVLRPDYESSKEMNLAMIEFFRESTSQFN